MLSGRPFLLKKLYDGNRIIAKNKESKNGTIISTGKRREYQLLKKKTKNEVY